MEIKSNATAGRSV